MVWVGNIKVSFCRPELAIAFQFWANTFIAILVTEFKDGKHLLGYLVYPPRAVLKMTLIAYFIFDSPSLVFGPFSFSNVCIKRHSVCFLG